MASRKNILFALLLLFLCSGWKSARLISVSGAGIHPGNLPQNASSSTGIETQATYKLFLPLVLYKTVETPVPVGPLGGTFTALAVDPGQNDNIYAGSFASGVYKSYDQGVTWYWKSAGLTNLQVQSLAAHPSSSLIVYAGTYEGGIFKSNDAGEHWAASNGGILNGHIVYDIEIDPSNPNTLYIVTRIKNSLVGYLYRSTNGGASWALLLTGNIFDSPDYFYDVDIQPGHSNVILLTTHMHGFYKSTNSGASFFAINTNITDLSARSIVMDPAYAGLIYGGVWHGAGVYTSWNGGISWQNTRSGLPDNVRVMGVELDPFGRTQKRVFAYTFGNGLYSSDNFGGGWVSRGLGGQSLNDFFVADGSPQRWYAASQDNGIFRSSTYGQSWISSSGTLSLNNITGIVAGELEEDGLYVSIFGKGIFKVTAAGTNWEEMNAGLDNLDVISLVRLEDNLAALTETGLYQYSGSTWSKVGDLPEIKRPWGTEEEEFLGKRINAHFELLESENGVFNFGNDDRLLGTDVPLLTSAGSFKGRLFAGTIGSGLLTYQDGQWAPFDFPEKSVLALATSGDSHALYALAEKQNFECEVLRFDGSGWMPLGKTFDCGKVNSLKAIGSELYLATDQGVLIWEEDDQIWHPSLTTDMPVYALAGSPNDLCQIMAAGQGSVFWSADCGASWQQYVGVLGNWRYQELALDPTDDHLLLIGSKEAGAFTIRLGD